MSCPASAAKGCAARVSRVALLLVIAGLVHADSRADSRETQGFLDWKSGRCATPEQDANTLARAIDAAARDTDRHVVVQLRHAVNAAKRARLAAAGLDLQHYLGDNAFFAVIQTGSTDAAGLSASGLLRCVVPIERQWKLHPEILAADWPGWAVQRPRQPATDTTFVAAYVLFHADVLLEPDAVRICEWHGGHVRSVLRSVNGIVLELPGAAVDQLVDEDAVMWIEPPLPPLQTNNNDNRLRTGVAVAQEVPYALDGEGVTVLLYDGATADPDHPDFGDRCHVRDTASTHAHSTHVAGTIGGDGSVSGGLYRGMAPAVILESYGFQMDGQWQAGFLYTDPGDVEHDFGEAISVYGADIANGSIGTNAAANGYPCEWEGDYGVTAALIDTIVRGDGDNPLFTEPFRIVWANGNEREAVRCGSTYHTTAPPACAKNSITVGALNSDDDSMTDFTSWGPTDDDRLKPDIAAPGCQVGDDQGVTSCNADGGYQAACGTSMAAPTVCGLGALLLQDFRAHYPDRPDFRNATLKALLAHTAADVETPGPDYKTGYGSVRVLPALNLLRSGDFVEATVDHDGTWLAVVEVGPEDTELKVTLAWDDVPGTPNMLPVLVNDLDLRVVDAEDTLYYPWTLGGLADPAVPAIRTTADHVNNIEQVVIDEPPPGTYRVEVYGYCIPAGPQGFSLTATPNLRNCASRGAALLNRSTYGCNTFALPTVVDCDLNSDDDLIETTTVMITSTSEPAGEPVVLTETGPDSASFTGSLAVSPMDAVGVLLVTQGDTVILTYDDADDGTGNPAVAIDTALVDCLPPVVSGVEVAELEAREATIVCDTDEPTMVTVRWGLACGALSESASPLGFRTSHSIKLAGLVQNTTYYYVIDAEDEAGNSITDDNEGECYAFTTPTLLESFTELYTDDNDLDNVSLIFVPDESLDFYDVCRESITALPTDPAGGMPLTLSDDAYVRVDLSGGKIVSLFGKPYTRFFVSSNGFITFDSGDATRWESLAAHFEQPRVSGLFDDLSPSAGGGVSWKQLADRVAITWLGVPQWSVGDANTFQIELLFDGRIVLNYLTISATDGLVGISAGDGIPAGFAETDFSAINTCGPWPPTVADIETRTDPGVPVPITLPADDDGEPAGTLDVVVTSLPQHGSLFDAGSASCIVTTPHTLAGGGHDVYYTPHHAYRGPDSFTYMATDGGVPPTGGASAGAIVFIAVGQPELVHAVFMDEDPGWSVTGQWAFGQPAGLGGLLHGDPDPFGGATGNYVYGVNLAGDYATVVGGPYYLTTSRFDLTDVFKPRLRFQRWLNSDYRPYVRASVEASGDGSTWTVVWTNDGGELRADAWSLQDCDLSPALDGSTTAYVRWGYQIGYGAWSYAGWNIDDVEIWGLRPLLPPACAGDVDCNGQVDYADIDRFVEALGCPDGAGWPYSCPWLNGDCTEDGVVDYADIDAFVLRIGTTCP